MLKLQRNTIEKINLWPYTDILQSQNMVLVDPASAIVLSTT